MNDDPKVPPREVRMGDTAGAADQITVSGPAPADVDRARELAGLLDRIQADPGGKLDRILGELAVIRSALDTVSARLAALEAAVPPEDERR